MPLIERIMGNARAEGAKRFVANAHYRADQILAHFGGLLKVSREDELLGTGGGVKRRFADAAFRSDPRDEHRCLLAGRERCAARPDAGALSPGPTISCCSACIRAMRPGFARSHDFCLSPQGEITRDYGAPVIYAGVALLGKNLFDGTPDGAFSLTELFEAALERETLHGVVLDAPWFHVGDPEALAEAERQLTP